MRLTVHLDKPFFVTKEQKIWKVKLENGKEDTVRKPKKPKCIVNTLSFKDLRNKDQIKEKLAYVKSHYGIRIAKETTHNWKRGQQMYEVKGVSPDIQLNLSQTLKDFCKRMYDEAIERASK